MASLSLLRDVSTVLGDPYYHERVGIDVIHGLIVEAVRAGVALCEVDDDAIRDAMNAAEAVLGVVMDQNLATVERVERLSVVIAVRDVAELARELDADPIRPLGAMPDEGEEAVETAAPGRAVEMLSLVGAKGLSARHVIVIGCDDVNLARTSRLTFYVALTRARLSLHLVVAAKSGGSRKPHGFLAELPAECCEYSIHKRGGPEPLVNIGALEARFRQWSRVAGRTALPGSRATRKGSP